MGWRCGLSGKVCFQRNNELRAFGITVTRIRFHIDVEKSKRLKATPERGIGFEEVRALFDAEHIIDRRSDDLEQFRAIGWVSGALYGVIYEVRQDADGEFHLPCDFMEGEKRRAYGETI